MAVSYTQLAPVLFGTDAVAAMAEKVAAEGLKKAFITCDKGIKASGSADKVADALKAQGVDAYIFDGCIPDAPDTFIDELAAVAKEWGADIMIGVGGGSSLDAAKAAGVVIDNGNPIATYMEENGNLGFVVKTPAYVVPTAAGTGSECTPMCVIHEMATDTKKVVLRTAQLAVLDPTLALSCPPSVTVNSGMDALSHAIEAYTSVNPNPKDMILAINAIKLIAENLYACIENPQDIEARSNMLFASNIAGIAFAEMSVHIGHCFAHEAGLKFQINHGLACGLATPETIEYVAEAKAKEIREIGEAIGAVIPADADAKAAAKVVADAVRALMKKCGMKSLKDMEITREEVVGIAKGAIDNNWFHIMCPGDVTVEQMAEFCGKVYDNYQ